MRLIDADELNETLRKRIIECNEANMILADFDFEAMIDDADSIEIVLCKDCKHWQKTNIRELDGSPIYDCPIFRGDWGDENGFCHYGERK